MNKIGIIGAGRFGMALAESLLESGIEVLLLDRNGQLVQQAASKVSLALQGDATNPRTLVEAGFPECDAVVVAIGSNLEVSMLVTSICKDFENDVEVIAKATSDIHGKILKKLGADRIIFPDRDSARRLASSISGHGALDILDVADDISVAEIDLPNEYSGKTLAEIDLRKNSGLTVLCIRRLNENPKKPRVIILPEPNDPLRGDDRVLVMGTAKQIDKFNEKS